MILHSSTIRQWSYQYQSLCHCNLRSHTWSSQTMEDLNG